MVKYLICGIAVYCSVTWINVYILNFSSFKEATKLEISKGLFFGIVLWPISMPYFIYTLGATKCQSKKQP